MAGVGQVPRSPPRTVGPVLVTPAPASTENGVAVPRPTVAWAADAAVLPATPPTSVGNSAMPTTARPRAIRPEKARRRPALSRGLCSVACRWRALDGTDSSG